MKTNILIGVAAFAGALYFFTRGARSNTSQPAKGASSYVGSPTLSFVSGAPVYIGAAQPRQGSVIDALFDRTVDLSNSTRTYGGSN